MKKTSFIIHPLFILYILLYSSCALFPQEDEKSINYLDSSYSWLKNRQLSNGLVPTFEYAYYTGTEGYEVSLYDNALAIIAFCLMEDYHLAEKTLDYFNARLTTEFAGINNHENGFYQFRNPSGNPNTGSNRWLGDNAWLLIAINNYHNMAGNTDYQNLADELTAWITNLQDVSGAPFTEFLDGGIFSGYDPSNAVITNKVVEGNLDVFNAISGYTTFHSVLLAYLGTRWDSTDNLFIAWPGNSNPDHIYAMDTAPWGYCALPEIPLATLTSANRWKLTKTPSYSSTPIDGFCFDEDLDTIWFEGIGEMVVAYNTAGMTADADFYLAEMEKAFMESRAYPGLYGLPYVSDINATDGTPATHYANGELYEQQDSSPHVSSITWYIFGKKGFDPFAVGRKTSVPPGDIPW